MKRPLLACLLAAAALPAGCQTGRKLSVSANPPRAVQKVDQIDLSLIPPTPLNWDDDPGLDGFQVQVFFWRQDEKLSVTIDGTLEFLLYEGRCTAAELVGKKPFHTWTFKNPELSTFLGKSMVGWGYAMRLDWGQHVPTTRTVTLVARYIPPRGPAKLSAPALVAMGAT